MRLRMSVSRRPVEPQVLEEVVDIVGGRLSYLNKVHPSAGTLPFCILIFPDRPPGLAI